MDASICLLAERGPLLARPHADHVKGSRHANMKELRTQIHGSPYRTLFAFDPRRTAILLIGRDKTGDNLWYDRMIPVADRLYRKIRGQTPISFSRCVGMQYIHAAETTDSLI
ncbi:type II toxin-antitoxin system RelE/ParE family toxin [Magnetovirga frankeli]|uniref:type II toxin-antitoxin system RelE/ParE family toxin n=1 Tax=Magnetovirga frankeli TaxID=947516 RepID=UPI003D33552B